MRPPLTPEEQETMTHLLAGHIVPGKAICPCCLERPMGAKSKSCRYCVTGHTRNKPGRKRTFTDEQMLDAIREGHDTPTRLTAHLDMKSKSSVMIHLRRLRDAGLVTFDEYAISGRAVKHGRIVVKEEEES